MEAHLFFGGNFFLLLCFFAATARLGSGQLWFALQLAVTLSELVALLAVTPPITSALLNGMAAEAIPLTRRGRLMVTAKRGHVPSLVPVVAAWQPL